MNLSSRPLLATQRDQELFVGRTWERGEILRDLGRGFNVVVEGDRGSGKTTLLRSLLWVHHQSADPGEHEIYVRAAGLTSTAEVLNRVLDALEERDTPPERSLGLPAALRELEEQRQARGSVCVLLDDVDPRVGNQVFGMLRDELWETGVQWVVTVNSGDAETLLAPPADAFFETVMRLSPLSLDESIELLEHRMVDVSQAIVLALAEGGGQPRELIERARRVDVNDDPKAIRASASTAEIHRRLSQLGRPANMLYAEIQHRDPVSASDEAIQNLMGWTRPRLIQVLGELEQAGLVKASVLVQSGPGRPKKVFRVLSPTEIERATTQEQGS